MANDWSDYQEEAANFFRSLGLDAETNVKIQGVRTTHDIDVVVKSQHVGFETIWLVECKFWNSRVTKLHVLGLREIVADTGADRGVILAENGFQSGATEAAALTNVHLTSLAKARIEARNEVFGMRLSELYDRFEAAREIYWSIPKHTRIECGLRPDTMESGYSGAAVISLAESLLRKGLRGTYPFEPDYMFRHAIKDFPESIESVESLVTLLESLLGDLEQRLTKCIQKSG